MIRKDRLNAHWQLLEVFCLPYDIHLYPLEMSKS